MGRFRKKPVVVEAVRFISGERFEDMPDWLWVEIDDGNVDFDEDGGLTVWNDSNFSRALPGDWIVQGTQGELYAVTSCVFAEIYEPADLVDVEGAVAALRS